MCMRGSRRGLSLLEILLTMSLMVVVLTLILWYFQGTAHFWRSHLKMWSGQLSSVETSVEILRWGVNGIAVQVGSSKLPAKYLYVRYRIDDTVWKIDLSDLDGCMLSRNEEYLRSSTKGYLYKPQGRWVLGLGAYTGNLAYVEVFNQYKALHHDVEWESVTNSSGRWLIKEAHVGWFHPVWWTNRQQQLTPAPYGGKLKIRTGDGESCTGLGVALRDVRNKEGGYLHSPPKIYGRGIHGLINVGRDGIRVGQFVVKQGYLGGAVTFWPAGRWKVELEDRRLPRGVLLDSWVFVEFFRRRDKGAYRSIIRGALPGMYIAVAVIKDSDGNAGKIRMGDSIYELFVPSIAAPGQSKAATEWELYVFSYNPTDIITQATVNFDRDYLMKNVFWFWFKTRKPGDVIGQWDVEYYNIDQARSSGTLPNVIDRLYAELKDMDKIMKLDGNGNDFTVADVEALERRINDIFNGNGTVKDARLAVAVRTTHLVGSGVNFRYVKYMKERLATGHFTTIGYPGLPVTFIGVDNNGQVYEYRLRRSNRKQTSAPIKHLPEGAVAWDFWVYF